MSVPKQIGKKFWHVNYERKYASACTKCGTLRNKGEHDYSFNSDQFCSNCGKSFAAETIKTAVPIYVIGVYVDWQGRKGYQLSETHPKDINEKGYSYWSYLEEQLGTEYYASKGQVEL